MNTFEFVANAVAILGCFIAMVLVLLSRKIRDDSETHANIHLLINLAASYSAYMVGSSTVVKSIVPCVAIAVVSYFTQLCAWGWILAMTFILLKKTFSTIVKPSKRYMGYTFCAVYLCCIIISAVSLVVSFTGNYEDLRDGWVPSKQNEFYFAAFVISDVLCWLRGPALYYGMLAPICAAFTVIVITCVIILRRNRKSENLSHLVKRNILRIFSIMGPVSFHLITITIMSTLAEEQKIKNLGLIIAIIHVFTGAILAILFAVDICRMTERKKSKEEDTTNENNL